MKYRFKEVSLDDVVDIYVDNRGKTVPTAKKSEEYLPLIATNCITDSLYPEFLKTRSISEETYNHWFRDQPKPNDIIFVNKGTPGKVALVPDPVNFVIAQDMVALRINEEFNNNYIYALLKSNRVKKTIENMHVGTMIPHFKKKDFSNLQLTIIDDLFIQKRIGNLYMMFSKKIELNNQMIDTLENMASTLFKRWFVDFEFPDENGNPYKSSGGKMIDSELGEIPEGWRIIPLSEVCSVKDGTHDSPKQVEIGYPLVTSKHLKKNKIDVSEAKLISRQDYEKTNVRSKVHQFDILISMIGTVGRTFYVTDNKIEFAIKNIGLIKTSEIRNLSTFIYLQFTSERVANFITLNTTGSTQQYISLTNLRKIPILMPSESILKKFHDLVASTFSLSDCLKKEIDTLEDTRDVLLPKLLSGELEV